MLEKQIKFLFSKTLLIRISQNFFIVFGTIWLFIESASFFLPEQTNNHRTVLFQLAVVGSCTLSFIFSFTKLGYNKKFKNSNVEIALKVGDLLTEMDDKGSNIVVGINNRFCIKKDRYAGSRSGGKSIRAQIATKFYQSKSNLLDIDIVKSLSNKQLVDKLDEVYQAPIGEVSVIDINQNKIFFLINQ